MPARHRLAIGSFLMLLVGAFFLVRHATKSAAEFEGVNGIELHYPSDVNIDHLRIAFAEGGHAGNLTFYTMEDGAWTTQAGVRGNASSQIMLEMRSAQCVTTSRIRILFSRPAAPPWVHLLAVEGIYQGRAFPVVPAVEFFGTFRPTHLSEGNVLTGASNTLSIPTTGQGIRLYVERFTVCPRLLNIHLLGRPWENLVLSVVLLVLISSFVFVPGFVLSSRWTSHGLPEQFCLAWVVGVFLLFLFSLLTLGVGHWASWLYVAVVGVSGLLFVRQDLSHRLALLGWGYPVAMALCASISLCLCMLHNTGQNMPCEMPGLEHQADYLIQYNMSQIFYHGLDGKGPFSEVWLWGWKLMDRTPLVPMSAVPLLVGLGNVFKVYEIYMVLLIALGPMAGMLLASRWLGERAARCAGILLAILPLHHVVGVSYPFRSLMCALLLLGVHFCRPDSSSSPTLRRVLAGALCALGYLAHPNAVPWLAGIGLYAVVTEKDRRARVRSALWIGGGVGSVFVAWNLCSRWYGEPSVFYLYPLFLEGWGDAVQYGKDGVLARFQKATWFVVISNRVQTLLAAVLIWYEREGWLDRSAPYWMTLTGGVGLSIVGFACYDVWSRWKNVGSLVLCCVVVPILLQVALVGLFERVLAFCMLPSVLIMVLLGAEVVMRLRAGWRTTVLAFACAEGLFTVWICWIDIASREWATILMAGACALATCLAFWWMARQVTDDPRRARPGGRG